LIVAAQAGDDKAMRRLIDAHVRWIKYHAGLRWDRSVRRNDPSAIAIDDLVSVGIAEFARHVHTWKPPHSLNTHYRKAVIGALADAAHWHRNIAGLGGMESDIQRFLRSHLNLEIEEVQEFCRRFPNVTLSEFEFELNTYRNIVTSETYSEAGDGDDDSDGSGDPKKDEAFQTDIDADLDSASVADVIGEWTLTASRHDKRNRYFADGWWSVWNPPPQVGWERRDLNDRLAPIIKVAEREPLKITDQWRPQSGYVDENDYRGLGEGLSSQRSCAVKPPPPMPTGQASPYASYWNASYGVDRLLYARRSLNLLPLDPPNPFDAAISSSIGATNITTSNDNDDLQDIAA
jgi:hypothetical protein